jgi:type IV pilus assembly protein PilA
MNIQSIRARRNKKGFTLIELLVVVLILAILMAVALPLYLNAVADSEKKTCRANMQTIANAVQAARVSSRASSYSPYFGVVGTGVTVGTGGALPDLQAAPKCPSAATNTYTIATSSSGAGYTVSCTDSTHGSFTPGVDNT